ncbi:PIN domain-containing protein [Magnetovirga frankeli]|uniref:PIN domain-containing protein n=1 Tax=Magnetovirga frankeli TaxID=947516 RepID=UPI001AF720F9|nr:PIN domain-containing protein [gamma proteobacterium SS-5]
MGPVYLLDTSALLTARDKEPGWERVAELLYAAWDGKTICLGCFITLMEVYYRVWKDENTLAGRSAYQGCLALPIQWVHESPALLERAAMLKATHRLSLADAWIAAAALESEAILIHKDPEFESLESVAQERLPYK